MHDPWLHSKQFIWTFDRVSVYTKTHVSIGDQSNERVGGIKQQRAQLGVMRFKLRFLIYAPSQPASKRASICAGETRRARNNGHTQQPSTHSYTREFAGSVSNYSWEIKAPQADSSSANVPLLFWLTCECVCVCLQRHGLLWATRVICLASTRHVNTYARTSKLVTAVEQQIKLGGQCEIEYCHQKHIWRPMASVVSPVCIQAAINFCLAVGIGPFANMTFFTRLSFDWACNGELIWETASQI